jgi:hypothetical protein
MFLNRSVHLWHSKDKVYREREDPHLTSDPLPSAQPKLSHYQLSAAITFSPYLPELSQTTLIQIKAPMSPFDWCTRTLLIFHLTYLLGIPQLSGHGEVVNLCA